MRHSVLIRVLALAVATSFAASAANAADAAVLRVGDQRGGTRAVLEASGQLKDVPYKIEWSDFPNAAPLLEALRANAIDAGGVGDAPLLFAQAAGAPVRGVSAIRSEAHGVAIVANAKSTLNGAASLKGKRIATTRGSIGHYLALAALQKAGLKPSEVTFVYLGPSDAKAALASGDVDAWAVWDPYVAIAQVNDKAKIVVDGTGLVSGLSFEAATEDAIRNKRAALADFLKRQAASVQWATAHPQEYAEIQAKITGLSVAVHKFAAERARTEPIAIDQKVVAEQQKTADGWLAAGVIPARINAGQGLDPSFNVTAAR
ncbi:ABC transporter substrate-binding protein [Amantichitinum ursilacus]|uniref:Putative aliphatic sulfonates-binding protein n=1 Tax=Amantichitinum ursilacus TaxID=857265 RepID=A0A0N0XGY4_9NEIS|nr:ABC transporter substrate-binding protein [Amantichitinum ursilacus]KPC50659.1 putative aliphatic sulfonates-binding protein precursor [Amantichitinum ursilacus]